MPSRPTCYNCLHHGLCKLEPDWAHFDIKDDKQADRWFHIVPIIIAEICKHFKEREHGN